MVEPFVVLMWKNFLVRRRRYLMSSIEIIMPIFLLLPLITLKLPKPCLMPRMEPYMRALEGIPQIMYSPDTKVTKILMDDVADALNISQFQSLPRNDDEDSLGSSSENLQIYRALEKVDAVIVFENVYSNETLPDKLTYTVRMKEEPGFRDSLRSSIMWQSIFGIADKLGDSFLMLQWAIDSRFIKMKSSSTFELPNIIIRQRSSRPNVDCLYFNGLLLDAIVFLTPLISFVLVMIHLNEERCSGVEALFEVSGVPWFIIDLTNFLDSLLPCFISSVIGAVSLPLQSNKLIIFMFLFLNGLSMIALAFTCSNITTCGANVASTALFIYVGTFLLDLAIWPASSHRAILRLKGLLPHMPAIWFTYQIYIKEFFKRFLGKKIDYISPNTSSHDPAYDRYFEDPPNDMDVAVEVVDVKKTYYSRLASVVALNGVSLKVYKGEITVIVGPNGSGKTTLLAIIAGMQNQSSGKVFVDRVDTSTSKRTKKMAFCPQKSILLPVLTVQEHLMLFAKIAGNAKEAMKKTIDRVMTQMDLNVKEMSMPSQLSVGFQRRLQIGCLLCSQASLLLLDDPTAEIDVEARRDLYKILSVLRGERTIIMTTNFLEEAEMFGDRIAALQRGDLRCFASPQFLKKAIDIGSRVNVTSVQPTDLDFVTKTIRGVAPDATLSKNVMGSLVYNIPPGSNMKAIFETLESNKDAMDIEALGVCSVPLEEAFMKLCTDGETDTSKEREKVLKTPDEIGHTKGFWLLLIQTRELFKRQLDYTYSRLLAFIFLHSFTPAFVTMLLFIYFKTIMLTWDWHSGATVTIKMYNQFITPSAGYSLNGYDTNKTIHTVNILNKIFPQLQFRESEVEDENCSCAKCKKIDENSTNIFDIYIDAHSAKLTYEQNVKYSASVGLNVLSNIIATQQMPYGDNQLITMRIGYGESYHPGIRQILSDEFNVGLFSIFIIFNLFPVALITVIDDVGLPCRERISNARYYHCMAGCPLWLYFLVTLIYQVVCYALVVLPSIMTITGIFDYDGTLKHVPAMRAYFACLLICGVSFYVLGYLLSQCFNEDTTKIILVLIMIIGLYSFLYMWICVGLQLYMLIFYAVFLNTQIFNPVFIYARTIKHLAVFASINQYCAEAHEKHLCPRQAMYLTVHEAEVCCNRSYEYGAWVPYFSETPYIALPSLTTKMAWISMYVIIFTISVLLIEYQLPSKLWNKYELRRKVVMPSRKYESNDVAAEKEYVKNTIMRSKETIKELMLVSRLWKIYFKLFDEEFLLKDLNYSVRKGECFGIVGLNGAGKTSVFKAITRQFLITKGLMFADGSFSHDDTMLYLKGLGYCPRSLSLDTFRTGSSNMRMLMCLRGIDGKDVINKCDAWQKVLGLERFRKVIVEEYSYGMERRLSVGAAMCRGERVLLLDQPMSGVDVAARREICVIMEGALANGCSIVHASHNLEVVDHICTQITILDAGEMGALGSPTEYKKSYAPGHLVIIKLRAISIIKSSGSTRVQALKDFMNLEFNSFLRDEYMLHLHFIVTKKLRYSVLHEKLKSMDNDFRDIVEDYSAYDEKFKDAFIQFVTDSRYSVKPQQTW